MKTHSLLGKLRLSSSLLVASLLGSVSLSEARTLDNFDDNTKTGWADFSFAPPLGVPSEADGMLKFEMPPIGQPIFSASQKVSEVLELKEGRTIELKVDLIEGGGKDSFAVLAFIPQATGPGTLAGYGLAKSTTDVLITKGVNKYFVADAGAQAALKNNNITLVLRMTVKNGNVLIHTEARDKDDGDKVIWQRDVVDTPEADSLEDGTDDPKAPWITKGYFTLYLYADFAANAPENPYKMYYDNAQVEVLDRTELDNFDDGTKTGWTDFSFAPPLGAPSEVDGLFKFEMPPIGQAIFSASQKTSRVFELKEGERTEFQVDIIEGGAKDSFAVLAFIPQATGPGTLAGYGLAKSTTDVLIIKGINKYFVADAGAQAALKNNNITLVLSMEVKDGNVIVHTEARDKDDNDKVIWQRTVVDTPEADSLEDGTDDPKAPWITKGYFTLYLYADFAANAPENPYKIYYDNAVVLAPPVTENVAPILSEIAPGEFVSFLPATTDVSFTASDDKNIADDKLSVTLNGVSYTSANGLVLGAAGTSRSATLAGKLVPNANYVAVFKVTDSDGVSISRTQYFDTFTASSFVVEVEDYNFGGGQFFNTSAALPEGSGPEDGAYSQQTGARDLDYSDTRATPSAANTKYRSQDAIRMQHTLDFQRAKYADAGGAEAQVFDYDVGDIAAGEWMNYTRDFPSGAYEVYLRESLANIATGESVLEQVIGDPSAPDQATRLIGSFQGTRTGFQYRNVPLTDGGGQNVLRLNLQGVTTLRLRHVTPDPGDGSRFMNYLVFNRVGDIEFQRAQIASINPAPGATVETFEPQIVVSLQNRDTAVNAATIKLEVNGAVVTPIVVTGEQGAQVTYAMNPLPASDALNTAKISFKDSQGQEVSSSWSFTVFYKTLNPANRVSGSSDVNGMIVHVVQSPAGSPLQNSLLRAEEQIKPGSPIERVVDVTETAITINYDKKSGASHGSFTGDVTVPGIIPAETSNGLDDFTAEVTTYLQLSKGIHKFGVISDDGYKLSSGRTLSDILTAPLASHSGGPANETVEFMVPEAGLYPFRLLWYERGGDGYLEWFSIDRATGDKTLINDPSVAGSVQAFLSVKQGPVVQSAAALGTGFSDDPQVVVDAAAKQITLPVGAGSRFLRLSWPEGVSLKSVSLVDGLLVIRYE